MKGILIFGATSLARQAHYYAANDLGLNVLGFVVDDAFKTADSLLSLPILTWTEACKKYTPDDALFFVAIGYKNMRLREAGYNKIKAAGYNLSNIISNANFVATDVALGDNNIIMPGVVIEPGAAIGSNNVIWSNVTICHNSNIGNHNFIAANVTIGGEVTIGNQNFLGFSTTVLHQTIIGDETLIGAQSLVTRSTESLSEYRGTPAKKLRSIAADSGICI